MSTIFVIAGTFGVMAMGVGDSGGVSHKRSLSRERPFAEWATASSRNCRSTSVPADHGLCPAGGVGDVVGGDVESVSRRRVLTSTGWKQRHGSDFEFNDHKESASSPSGRAQHGVGADVADPWAAAGRVVGIHDVVLSLAGKSSKRVAWRLARRRCRE